MVACDTKLGCSTALEGGRAIVPFVREVAAVTARDDARGELLGEGFAMAVRDDGNVGIALAAWPLRERLGLALPLEDTAPRALKLLLPVLLLLLPAASIPSAPRVGEATPTLVMVLLLGALTAAILVVTVRKLRNDDMGDGAQEGDKAAEEEEEEAAASVMEAALSVTTDNVLVLLPAPGALWP